MSSGFVSGGTIDKPIERDDEWLKAEQELEEIRKRKDELARKNDGKSLYEVLQQNKGNYTDSSGALPSSFAGRANVAGGT